ncbi:MAG: choice-of-anchor J domain-containing protein [Bacteroidota bacterium]
MQKAFFFLVFQVLFYSTGFTQCNQWANPTSDQAYSVFPDLPCNGEMSPPASFQIWQSDAYEIPNVLEGATYTFSHCEGAGTWVPEYTVYAPSGSVEAFGSGVDGCSFTWTATESGLYIIAINEAENCGISGSTNNGFPTITTESGGTNCVEPPVFVEGAESFEDDNLPECWARSDEDGDILNWFVFDDSTKAFDGNQMMRSSSFIDDFGAVQPDNWLISSPRIIGDNDSLYYAVSALSETFPNEFYGVYVAVNADTIEAFEEVFSEELNTTEWQGRSINLPEYAGELVYIAFRHYNSVDQSALLIDAVALPGELIENCEEVLSVWNTQPKLEFLVFPNPSSGEINVSLKKSESRVQMDLFDINGRVVWSELITMNSGTAQIDLPNVEAGIYTLRLIGEESVGSQKLIIQ